MIQAHLLFADSHPTPLPKGAKPLAVGLIEKVVNGKPWAGPHVICSSEEGNAIVDHKFTSVPLGKSLPAGVKEEDAEFIGVINLEGVVFCVFYLGEVS